MSIDAPGTSGAPAEPDATVTINTIAREAGVSVATVSKVVNGRVDVASSTRLRVEEVIQRYGYRPRRATGAAGPALLELVFHELDSPWALEIIASVERVAGQHRLAVVLSELGGSHRPRQQWLDEVLQRRPRGVILVQSELAPEQRRQLESRSIPYVMVDTAGERLAGVPTVGSANWDGGLAATRHLLDLGHRRIAVITGPADVLCSRARVDGYRSALEEAGVELDQSLIRYGDFYVGGGYDHGRDLLGRPDRPTAIFAGSDYTALGVMRAARELGLSVPRDLSVVGYDNLPVAEWTAPMLTTIDQPLAEMAASATKMVIALAGGEAPASLRIDLATELVVRESTAPPV